MGKIVPSRQWLVILELKSYCAWGKLGVGGAPARQGEGAFEESFPKQQHSQPWCRPISFLFGIEIAQCGAGKVCWAFPQSVCVGFDLCQHHID